MGMYDNFIISLKNIEGVLSNKQLESITKSSKRNKFSSYTKDLENMNNTYEVKRNRLYIQTSEKDKAVKHTGKVFFGDNIKHLDGQAWVEFSIEFDDGKYVKESIKLVDFKTVVNKKKTTKIKPIKAVKPKKAIKAKQPNTLLGLFRKLLSIFK